MRAHRAHVQVRVASQAVTREHVVQMYPVYAREDVLGQTPLTFVTRAVRDQWVDEGSAVSMARGKAIRLTLNLVPRVASSLTMGPGIVEGAAMGKPFARALAEAWRRNAHPVVGMGFEVNVYEDLEPEMMDAEMVGFALRDGALSFAGVAA